MPQPAIRFTGVRKAFGSSVAVADVSLDVAAGQFVALVGASGSGKSTLLRTVNRLVEPDAGRVLLAGEDVADVSLPQLRRRIGYVFQHIGLFPHMDVAGNIGLALRLAGRDADGRVGELLDLIGLPRDFASRMPAGLSGGQAQRVGVARALAAGPSIMLMDEPFGALDPVTRDGLGRAYRALHDRLGMTTMMVTHDMAEALLMADRIVVMDRGAIVADLPPAALLAGEGGEVAQALVAVPRDQAERLRALEAGG
ncbi:ATP-binding cassette domain-containing protein [Sphingobium phenoxybenzoativorans]|uniref:ATP-binding cassette domain-containing protein n=1 Tax=Sphingobium phenoxybenzoativorans TaxID=1592790 RepID=A0A975K5L1_9SPHN|nr:ATP-binding cassette domain-containing protein [Sphingobium phenoxybenzoativorans]QUT05211.1 ATP-binding cassette domain-containing protein [Sphingobium phenoxybenzoativorans]